MRTVIIATLTEEQLSYLKNLANEQGIDAEFIVEGVETEEEVEQPAPSHTPITGQILEAIAVSTGKNSIEIAMIASQNGIESVEDALQSDIDIPSEVREILESYL